MIQRLVGVSVLWVCASCLAGDLNPPPGPVAPSMLTLDTVEPRTPISQADIPLTITAEGSYYLTENIFPPVNTAFLIGIQSDNVTLDLSGFTVIGATEVTVAQDGILIGAERRNCVVFNGAVRDCADDAVDGDDSIGTTLRHLRVENSGGAGLFVGPQGRIESCTAINCGASGVVGEFGTTIVDCISHLSGTTGYAIGTASTLERCVATASGSIGLNVGTGCTMIACTARLNQGNGISLNTGSSAESCASENNTGAGFAGADVSFSNCTARFNSGDGFSASGDGGVYTGCVASNNQGSGFDTAMGASLTGCSAVTNAQGGFASLDGTSYINCSANENVVFGFEMVNGSQASSCVARQNTGDGFRLNLSRAIECSSLSNTIDGFACEGNATADGCNAIGNGAIGYHLTGSTNMVVRCRAQVNSINEYQDNGVSSRVGTIRTTPVGAGPWDNFDF